LSTYAGTARKIFSLSIQPISPMLIMQGNEELFAKTVTFTQDNRGGTRTVLELCNKLAMEQAAGPT
jgi:hypothetical protein